MAKVQSIFNDSENLTVKTLEKSLIVLSCTMLLMACQSHQPPKPKGRWVNVNPVGFIPPNTTIYSIDITKQTLNTVKEPQKAGE